MVINTESTIGYNNQLKQATPGMKLSVNNDINLGTIKASLKLMDGGPSKVDPPNSHPSNPIHKQAMQALGLGEKKSKKACVTPTEEPTSTQTEEPASKQTDSDIEPHHINKAIIAIGAVVLAGLVVWMRKRLCLIVFSIKKAATARIRSQAFLPRKEITWPAVGNTKLTIKPSKPGRMELIFSPNSCKPLPTPLASAFSPFVR